MPGLFGGGGSDQTTGGPTNIPIKAIAPPWMKNQQTVMSPMGAPGQVDALARQMSAGGFGTPVADYSWLKSFYKPSPTSVYAPPAPKPKDKPKVPPVVPKVPPVGPSGHTLVTGATGRNSR